MRGPDRKQDAMADLSKGLKVDQNSAASKGTLTAAASPSSRSRGRQSQSGSHLALTGLCPVLPSTVRPQLF